ncbi:MAG: ROK family protein, partial [Chloroflexi bacterium]|nr:ROK family protein [Chloroflexota bacterium]
PLALAVDVGGSKILTALANSSGKIFSRDLRITPAIEGPQAVINSVIASSKHTLAEAGATIAEIKVIGISIAGISDPKKGVVFSSPHLPGWHNVLLKRIMEKELGKKTFLLNDANAAALGELYFGAGRGTRNFIYITISTGIGGGIVINGELYSGAFGMAGEVGHMTIDDAGPLCDCGNSGCWEALASGTALTREARHRINEGARTSILDYAGGEIEQVTAQVIHTAAKGGDALAQELIAQTGYYLGVGLANLINIFNPELIVIGGGLANIGDRLLQPAFKVAGERALHEPYQKLRFAYAELGQDSGVLGAAAFALQQVPRGVK